MSACENATYYIYFGVHLRTTFQKGCFFKRKRRGRSEKAQSAFSVSARNITLTALIFTFSKKMLEILAEMAYIDSTSIKRSAYEKDLDVCIKKEKKYGK